MKFLNYIDLLLNEAGTDVRYTPNHTRLIGYFDGMDDRVSVHQLHAPMTTQMLLELQKSYRFDIPNQLLEIYRVANGCFLCAGLMQLGSYRLPTSRLTILGLPTGSAYDDCQPFNIIIEDGERPRNIPKTWLKFASYLELYDETFHGEYDLFVDTADGTVWAFARKQKKVNLKKPEFHWNTIDECLCSLYEQAVQYMHNDVEV